MSMMPDENPDSTITIPANTQQDLARSLQALVKAKPECGRYAGSRTTMWERGFVITPAGGSHLSALVDRDLADAAGDRSGVLDRITVRYHVETHFEFGRRDFFLAKADFQITCGVYSGMPTKVQMAEMIMARGVFEDDIVDLSGTSDPEITKGAVARMIVARGSRKPPSASCASTRCPSTRNRSPRRSPEQPTERPRTRKARRPRSTGLYSWRSGRDQAATRSFSALAGEKATFLPAAIVIAAPVAGLRPSRSAVSLRVNLPKPAIATSSPAETAAPIASIEASKALRASAFVRPVEAATLSTRSFVFKSVLRVADRSMRWNNHRTIACYHKRKMPIPLGFSVFFTVIMHC